MPSGRVKWFNAKKGYGFISEDKTDKDIFLHVSSLEKSKLRVLKENQRLRYIQFGVIGVVACIRTSISTTPDKTDNNQRQPKETKIKMSKVI